MTASSSNGMAGRRVVITGAASGIGRATALAASVEGAHVALLDAQAIDERDVEACEALGGSARAWQVDVAHASQVGHALDAASDWLGGIDAVLHVAGIVDGVDVALDAIQVDQWRRVLEVNLTGALYVMQHAIPHLESSGGCLVVVGSGAGVTNGHRSIPYASSKGGLNGLVLAAEQDLRQRGVRLNLLAPGSVDTPLVRQHEQNVDALVAAGRTIEPAAVADVLVYLASARADAVRGVVRTW